MRVITPLAMEHLISQNSDYFWSLKKGGDHILKLLQFLHHSPDLDVIKLKAESLHFELTCI